MAVRNLNEFGIDFGASAAMRGCDFMDEQAATPTFGEHGVLKLSGWVDDNRLTAECCKHCNR